jgi:hypothetical protein
MSQFPYVCIPISVDRPGFQAKVLLLSFLNLFIIKNHQSYFLRPYPMMWKNINYGGIYGSHSIS